jgi:HEAT repeat protein/thioredoxin-like negative regulator of GroEL
VNPLLPLALLLAAAAGDDPAPKDLAGWMDRQDALVASGAGEKAVAEAAARAAKEPGSAEALFLHGRILGNTGDVDGARTKFQAAVDADPNYSPGWRGLCLVHLRKKEYETAAREARRAYELDESRENRILLVQALYQNGDRPGAYRILKDALARTPEDLDLRSYYASLLLNEGLFRDSERELRQILASDAGHIAARQMLVGVLTSTGRKPEAATECRELVKRSPRDPRLRILLRDLLVGQKDFEGAAVVMEDLLKMDLPADARGDLEADLRKLRAAADQAAEDVSRGVPATAELTYGEIFQQLESKDVSVRRAAMRTLSAYRLPYLPGALLRCAGDEDETVRLAAIRLIGQNGQADVLWIPNLRLFHSKEKDPSLAVRVRCVQAVGRIGSPAGLLVLYRCFEEPEPEIVGAAVKAIRDLTGKCFADDPDAPLAAEEVKGVRERAARWWFENPTARQWRCKAADAVAAAAGGPTRDLAWYLVPWLQEEDPVIRAAVLGTFARITGDAAWKALPTGTKEEREAARDRAYAILAAKDTPSPAPEKK